MIAIDSTEALTRLLAEHKPTLLLWCRSSELFGTFETPEIAARIDERFSWEQAGFAVRGVDLSPLLQGSIAGGSSALRRIASSSSGDPSRFARSFTILVDPPIVADCWVTATVKIDALPGATPLLYTATVNGGGSAYAVMPRSNRLQRLSVYLSPRPANTGGPDRITFQLVQGYSGGPIVQGSVIDVGFEAYPVVRWK